MPRLSFLAKTLSGRGHEGYPEQVDEPGLPINPTLFQSFEWYIPTPSPTSPSHYQVLAALLPVLSTIGITLVWLPPGCKASNPKGNGYDIYDIWDLGEFDQKGSRRTKWGTKEELEIFCRMAEELKIGVIWDAVLNHKAGADGKENALAVKVDPKDRTKVISTPHEIESWTLFSFPGREGMYSSMKYSSEHFSGIDEDARSHQKGIFKFVGEDRLSEWAQDVSNELSNYDYLMFADVSHAHPAVCSDFLAWGEWIISTLSLAGMRLDAIKHYSLSFISAFISHLQSHTALGKDLFFVGEYWDAQLPHLEAILSATHGTMRLMDVQLLYNLSDFSKGRQRDLRRIFDGTLTIAQPEAAVTFVANHDTQATQSLEAPVANWFVPHAYALILLRETKSLPILFWGDFMGTNGPSPRLPAMGGRLCRLVAARNLWAYGPQKTYFDSADYVGWTRLGHRDHGGGGGLAVLINSSWERKGKRMFVGSRHAGERWSDVLGWNDSVAIDRKGFATFRVSHRSIGVWTREGVDLERVQALVFPPEGSIEAGL